MISNNIIPQNEVVCQDNFSVFQPPQYSQREPPQYQPPSTNHYQQQQPITPSVKWFTEVAEKPKLWLWYPYFRQGKVNVLNAVQGCGKSTFVCWLASVLSRGDKRLLPLHNKCPNFNQFQDTPLNSLIINCEDDPSEDIVGRLNRCNADKSRIAYVDVSGLTINFYSPLIEQWIIQSQASLVIFDPTSQFFVGKDLNGQPLEMNSSQSVRPIMTHLKRIAEKHNTCIILVTHPPKDRNKSALHSVAGSADFTAAPRSAVQIGYDIDTETHGKNSRILSLLKSNSVPDNDKISMRYHLDYENGVICFDGESTYTSDEIKDGISNDKPERKPTLAELKLESLFKERAEYPVTEIMVLLSGEFSQKTIYNARKRLGYIKEDYIDRKTKTKKWYSELCYVESDSNNAPCKENNSDNI